MSSSPSNSSALTGVEALTGVRAAGVEALTGVRALVESAVAA